MPQPCGMSPWVSMKAVCKTEYTVQKRSAVVYYQALSICLTLILCWVRYCPTPPSWENILCSEVSIKLSVVSDSSPKLNYQEPNGDTMVPKSLVMLTKPRDVFTSRSSVVTQRCFPSAAKPLARRVWVWHPSPHCSSFLSGCQHISYWGMNTELTSWMVETISKIKFECFSLNRLRSE